MPAAATPAADDKSTAEGEPATNTWATRFRVSREPRHVILAVLLLLSFVLRSCQLEATVNGPLGDVPESAASSDMNAFLVWGQRIADGDWLCRDTYHPMMDWMERLPDPTKPTNATDPTEPKYKLVTLEKFHEWWGGKEIYHQNPLYPYLLAISLLLFGSITPLLFLQVLTSTLSILLVYDIGRRLVDVRAGLIAAGMTALFAPSIVFDAILLRTALNSSLTLLSIWLLFKLEERPTARLAFGTGVVLAASFLLRPTGLAMIVAGPLLLLLLVGMRRTWRVWVPALAIGVVVMMSPFVVRNLIVGVSPLTLSTRGPETVLQSHIVGSDPSSMQIDATNYFERMEKGSGSLVAAISTSIDSWPKDSALTDWMWHEWQKVICVFCDFEYPNNINFYFYRDFTSILALLPTFGWIVGLGLVGIVLMGFHGRHRVLALIPLAAIAALLLGSILGFALGRYRLPLAILMTIPAGATISILIVWLQAQTPRILNSVIALAATITLTVLSYTLAPKKIVRFDILPLEVQTTAERHLYQELQRRRPIEPTFGAMRLIERSNTASTPSAKERYRNQALQLLRRYTIDFIDFYRTRCTKMVKRINRADDFRARGNTSQDQVWYAERSKLLDFYHRAQDFHDRAKGIWSVLGENRIAQESHRHENDLKGRIVLLQRSANRTPPVPTPPRIERR